MGSRPDTSSSIKQSDGGNFLKDAGKDLKGASKGQCQAE